MEIEIKGLAEFREAIARNPAVIKKAINNFLVKGLQVYHQIIWRNPWSQGGAGGGAPVRTGNLRDSHKVDTSTPFEARIQATAPYADKVHNKGTTNIPPRPWLDYAVETGQKDIEKLADDMVETIVTNLAS